MNTLSAPVVGLQPDVSLDPNALDRLRELDPDGRHGAVTRVLTTFEGLLARLLAQLHDPPEGPRAEKVAEVAHTLKSSSASVGALELARVCTEIEQRLRGGDVAELERDIARLISAAEAARQAVGAILRA